MRHWSNRRREIWRDITLLVTLYPLWSRAASFLLYPIDTLSDLVDDLSAYLPARAEWIPNCRARRRQRHYIGSGLGEKANDRIVARRQKRRGTQWGAQTSDALAALRMLPLNKGWDHYWHERQLLHLSAA